MVIYLLKRNQLIHKILLFIILLIFIYSISYITSYTKYNNKKYIENNLLITENKILKEELNNIKYIKYENSNIAKVMYRDIYNFYDEVIINKGKKEVQVNDAVMNDEGLIGIVYKVDNNKSYIKLLSSNYNISVKINNTYGNLNKGTITMIDKYSSINVGDKVYTSGLDEVIGNIYIGEVISVSKDKDDLGKEIKIKYIDNTNLNYVAILRKIK